MSTTFGLVSITNLAYLGSLQSRALKTVYILVWIKEQWKLLAFCKSCSKLPFFLKNLLGYIQFLGQPAAKQLLCDGDLFELSQYWLHGSPMSKYCSPPQTWQLPIICCPPSDLSDLNNNCPAFPPRQATDLPSHQLLAISATKNFRIPSVISVDFSHGICSKLRFARDSEYYQIWFTTCCPH